MNQSTGAAPSTPSGDSKKVSPSAKKKSPQNQTNNNHVKRPLNPFIVFSQIERKKILAVAPEMHNAEISKQLGLKWSRLSPDDRLPFIVEAERLRQIHFLEHPDYKYKPKKREVKVLKRPRTTKNLFSDKQKKASMAKDSIPSQNFQAPSNSNKSSQMSSSNTLKINSPSHSNLFILSSLKTSKSNPALKDNPAIQPSPKSRNSPISKDNTPVHQTSPKLSRSNPTSNDIAVQPSPKPVSSAYEDNTSFQPSPKSSRSSPASKDRAVQPSPKSTRSSPASKDMAVQPSPKSTSSPTSKDMAVQPSQKSFSSPASKENTSVQASPKSARSSSTSVQPSPKSTRSSPASKENQSVQPSPKSARSSSVSVQPSPKSTRNSPASREKETVQLSPKSKRSSPASKENESVQPSPKSARSSPAVKENTSVHSSFKSTRSNPTFKENALVQPSKNPSKMSLVYEEKSSVQPTLKSTKKSTASKNKVANQSQTLNTSLNYELNEPSLKSHSAKSKISVSGSQKVDYQLPPTFIKSSACRVATENIEPQNTNPVKRTDSSSAVPFKRGSGEITETNDKENNETSDRKRIKPNPGKSTSLVDCKRSSLSLRNKSSSLKKNDKFHIDGSLTAGSICAIACTSEELSDTLDTYDILTENLICSVKNLDEEIQMLARAYKRISNEGKYASYKKYSFPDCVMPKLSDVLGKYWNDVALRFID